jgi:hypothetical protein
MSTSVAGPFSRNQGSPGQIREKREDWSYGDGFVEGWKLIAGERAAIPKTPSAPPALTGLALYKTGLLHGIEAAKKRKGIV